MLRKRLYLAFSLLMIVSMVLAACQTKEKIVTQIVNQTSVVKETQIVEKAGEETVVTKEVEVVVTKEVEKIVTQVVEKIVEVTPTPEVSTRKGGWLDQIVVVEEPSAEAAVKRLQTGDLDAYFYSVAKAEVLKTVQESPDLTYP